MTLDSHVSTPPWEVERHKRGSIRWYPFDQIIALGLNSAGSNRALAAPILSLDTGAATATPQNRGIESCERHAGASTSDIWTGIDGLNYWGRVHHATCFWGMGVSSVTPANAFLHAGIFLQEPGVNGLPPYPNPNKPFVLLRYTRSGLLAAGPDEHFELHTAIGDGSNAVVTRLTGVTGPVSDLGAGARTQRLEIWYNPGQWARAYVDGVLGAENTTGLPNVVTVPTTNQNMAGVGVWLEQCQLGDDGRADFHSLMIESYRP